MSILTMATNSYMEVPCSCSLYISASVSSQGSVAAGSLRCDNWLFLEIHRKYVNVCTCKLVFKDSTCTIFLKGMLVNPEVITKQDDFVCVLLNA